MSCAHRIILTSGKTFECKLTFFPSKSLSNTRCNQKSHKYSIVFVLTFSALLALLSRRVRGPERHNFIYFSLADSQASNSPRSKQNITTQSHFQVIFVNPVLLSLIIYQFLNYLKHTFMRSY